MEAGPRNRQTLRIHICNLPLLTARARHGSQVYVARDTGTLAWRNSRNWRIAVDQDRFDAITRQLAKGPSRRTLLGGLTAALGMAVLGRTQVSAAPGGYLAPGQECTDDSQCGDTRYNSMVCDENGTYDGTLHCCAYEYGYCWDDDGCCGDLVCSYGSCSPQGVFGVPLGQQCFSDDQCLDEDNGIICGNAGMMTRVCCVTGGNACTADSDCCLPNSCLNGFCQ